MKNIFYYIILILGLMSCRNQNVDGAPSSQIIEDDHSHDENENQVSLTQKQMETIGVELGEIEQKELQNVIRANGLLKVPNQSKAQVTSLYSGQIKSISVRPGDLVRKGQTIAVIENPSQVLVQEQYLNVMSQIQMTQTEVNRQKELYEGSAGALKNLQYAESQLKTLQTQKASLSKQLQMMGINPSSVSNRNLSSSMSVKAPISGEIGAVLVDIGAYVDMASPIVNIVDNSSLHLDLGVFEKDLAQVKKGQLIHFTLTNNPVKEYDAQIFSIGTAFEDGSKSIPVHARVDGDKSGLIDGMNVVALISIGESLVPAIPTEAIVNIGAEDFIFIVIGQEEDEFTFEKIPIVKGTTDVGYSQITPLIEIPDDSKIVTKGAFFVMSKLTNTGEDHHH